MPVVSVVSATALAAINPSVPMSVVTCVMSMVSVAAVPVNVRKVVSVMVRVSVAESATTLAPAGTAMVSKELPPPPALSTVIDPSPRSVRVMFDPANSPQGKYCVPPVFVSHRTKPAS